MHEFDVILKTEDGNLDAFICHPDENGPFPAIIFYMDAPGIREELRDMARRIATSGYFVVMPNMYYRWGTEGNYGFDLSNTAALEQEREKMFRLMDATTTDKVVTDTDALLHFIDQSDQADDSKIGAVGYCMSGKHIVAVGAAYSNRFQALASYYGVGIMTEEDNSPHLEAHKIKADLYLAFASDDPYVPDPLLTSIDNAMNEANINYRVEIYPETGHGFAFPLRPAYVKSQAEKHWERMLTLFERNLKN